jgi:hypothetical protein
MPEEFTRYTVSADVAAAVAAEPLPFLPGVEPR